MKIVIGFAVADPAVRTFLYTRRGHVIPADTVAKGYFHERNTQFVIQTYPLGAQTSPADIEDWLRGLAADTQGLILVIDSAARHLATDFEDAYFIAELRPHQGRVIQNAIWSALAPILRHYAAYCRHFDQFRSQKMLLLPFNVFEAAELATLRQRLTFDKMLPGFGQALDQLLKQLGTRERPKQRHRFRRVYMVDDRPLWYRYGPERHKLVETGVPPHLLRCWHNSRFRFGRQYDERLHYNVDDDSDPTVVHGQFVNCHGDIFTATGESHLGIFPNGFQ